LFRSHKFGIGIDFDSRFDEARFTARFFAHKPIPMGVEQPGLYIRPGCGMIERFFTDFFRSDDNPMPG
jgi:hypothetical protein